MDISEADIRQAVSHNAFRAGADYQARGQVLSCVQDGSGTLRARVIGHERRPYQLTISIEGRPGGGAEIDGMCSCPVGYNCKHVAAALLEWRKTVRPPPTPEQRAAELMRRAVALVPASATPSAMPPGLSGWLDSLVKAAATATEDYPSGVAQRLVYVLSALEVSPHPARLKVELMSARLLKDGTFADNARVYAVDRGQTDAKFLRPSDRRILAGLAQLRRDVYTATHQLFNEGADALLIDILATGRARWGALNGPPMARGEPRPAQVAWVEQGDDALRPMLQTEPGLMVLNATPPLYVDGPAGLIGPLETGLSPRVAAALLDAPPVPADQIGALNQALTKRMPALARIQPPEPEAAKAIEAAPVPCLLLLRAHLPAVATLGAYRGSSYGYAVLSEPVAMARLLFRYGPVTVPFGEAAATVRRLRDGKLLEARRDRDAERRHAATLLALDLAPAGDRRLGVPPAHARDFMLGDDEGEWLALLYHDLPALEAEGWQIEVDGDFPFRLLRSDAPFAAEVHERSGVDWFELDLGVMVDGERIDLIGPIAALLGAPSFDRAAFAAEEAGDEPLYLPLEDGRILAMPPQRLLPIVEAIEALLVGVAPGEKRLRLPAAEVAALAALEAAAGEAGMTWRGGERLRDMGRRLGATGGIPDAVLPATFEATLRPYQAAGVGWLAFLRDVGLGGILADDMGLGKTVQALALITIEKAAGRLDRPVLVIAPTSLMANWTREAERFAPDLRLLVLQGLDRKSRFGSIADSDVVLTTYPLIARDHAVLAQTTWHLMLLDEAQTIKNPEATTTKLVAGLPARHRFALTGTPLENHLGELWSLFSVVLPGFLGDRQGFTRLWRTPIEKGGDAARGRLLARRVKPFLLRRTKEEVARDLPPKTEIVERVEFQTAQRDIYESIRLTMHQKVRDAVAEKGFARSRIVILDALLKLRQACCDPRLLKLNAKAADKAGSAKLDRLMEMIEELVAEKRRILVFSQFTSMLDLIRPRLDEAAIPYALLTGQTRDRPAAIGQFQDGKVPVFLVSLKAGGTGLNLTTADTVILYDPWWNPAVEEQAIDRAHRIGQDKPVFVHKLVAVGTIEEKMEVLKAKKRALAESLFDHDGAPTLAMTEADLDMLFAA